MSDGDEGEGGVTRPRTPLPALTGSASPTPSSMLGAGELTPDQFRAIVDHSAHPYIVIDDAGIVRYAGASVPRVIGWAPEQLVGHHIVEFLPEDQIASALDAVGEIHGVNPTLAGAPMVFGIVGPDGETGWIEVGGLPMHDLEGGPGIALRMRAWEGQHHLEGFLESLLAHDSLDEVLVPLSHAIAVTLEAPGAAVHHGFDGSVFGGASAWGVPESCRSIEDKPAPWVEAAVQGDPVNCMADELTPSLSEAAQRAGFGACWCIPVTGTDAVAPAVLTVWQHDAVPPYVGHRFALERSARYVRLALVRTSEHQRLKHLAGHDSLTGVANRATFRDRLARALAIGETSLAVAFCDLDGFKPVNDRYGHRAGDGVLVEVAERLRDTLRMGDEIARIGGDEFTLLLRNVPDEPAVVHLTDRLHAAMDEPFTVAGDPVMLGISIGISLLDGSTIDTADAALARADAALYEVKRAGGGRSRIAR